MSSSVLFYEKINTNNASTLLWVEVWDPSECDGGPAAGAARAEGALHRSANGFRDAGGTNGVGS